MARRILMFMLLVCPTVWVTGTVALVAVMRFTPVVLTPLMVRRSIENIGNDGYRTTRCWVPLEKVSRPVIRAVVAAEDARFVSHDGFDWKAIAEMKSSHRIYDSAVRGCSTISQQTAKNCFTFCTRSVFRKAVETYFTFLIEHIWGKRRIMEVYLNVVELGPGVFGIEAAAERYYGMHACDLKLADASVMACLLPHPLVRTPAYVTRFMGNRRQQIALAARGNPVWL